ncbi:MAG: hybrid sensor histidine kinase/response regulator [Bacteroidetes bacterium]|nr:hybrid sensor histidine kinase/response regulator [Bacteroidota bacterium]
MEYKTPKAKVLYIDDEENNLLVFKSSFRRYYEIFTAISGEEAMKIIRDHDIAVIITDQRMPGMTGIEFLKQLPEDLLAIRMILTGYSDVAAVIEAINTGKVYRYITKPWNQDELKISIDNAYEAHSLKLRNQLLISELKETNEQLEQKVLHRTAALEKALDEISIQKEKLEELNATKNKFFSIVAHDLRNPVNALSAFSATLAEHGDKMSTEDIRHFSRDLNKSMKNAINLIKNLLNWASTQMNQLNHEPREIALNALVEETFEQLYSMAVQKEISLEKDLLPNINVCADVNHLQLILRNLASNAIKFTPAGGQVTISTRIKQNGSPKAELVVSDTGVGMSKEKLARLFKIGHALNTKGTAGEKGTGLGLILCKEFAEKNGGILSVESQEGKGSTFTISFDTI